MKALDVFEEILNRGAMFYPNADEATKGITGGASGD